MNIALIVHFTPQTLREARGGSYVVSSSEMAGGKIKDTSRGPRAPQQALGGKRGKKRWGWGGGVDIL